MVLMMDAPGRPRGGRMGCGRGFAVFGGGGGGAGAGAGCDFGSFVFADPESCELFLSCARQNEVSESR